MRTRFQRPVGTLGPRPGNPSRRRASTFDTGAGSATRVERGPLGPCGGQRHEGRDRQRGGGTWWRGLFLSGGGDAGEPQ